MRFLWKGRVIDFYSKNVDMALASLLPCQPRDVCVSKLKVQECTRRYILEQPVDKLFRLQATVYTESSF